MDIIVNVARHKAHNRDEICIDDYMQMPVPPGEEILNRVSRISKTFQARKRWAAK